ncbi:MAG: acetolactate decarboxylase [Thermodesulfobacteriota bacterium]|jgi:acetolactate decarboxylase|nr:MAG: acetolactate decarboxylase [Thermodesulfobacteriota bacterium]
MINNPVFSKLELNLPQDQLNRLTILAERMGVSVIDLIKQALRRFLFNEKGGNAVFISAPIIALVDGFYVEDTTMARIKEHGDFGLGTFNYLDGEMVILDGNVYQIRSDGDVYSVKDDEQSPFACVTFFSPDTFDAIEENHTPKEFYNLLNTLIPSENMLYAIRIDGAFSHVRTRAVLRSENYKPLVEATKNQPVFDFYDVQGCLAGFYTPRFMESLNAPGYHMHFLTEDRRHGGHLIECTLKSARIGIQHVPKLDVGLPITLDFLTADLTRDIGKDLDKAEK